MPEVDWTGITIDNGQCEYPDCPWCARLFFRWYKARINQMSMVRTKLGETTSFTDAAATSVVPGEVLRIDEDRIDASPIRGDDREDPVVSTLYPLASGTTREADSRLQVDAEVSGSDRDH